MASGTIARDTIYETSGGWSIIKFANGVAIASKTVSYTGAINTAVGSGFESAEIDCGNFPSGLFVDANIQRSVCPYSTGAYSWPALFSTSQTAFGKVRLFRFNARTYSDTHNIDCVAIGRWK